MSELRPSGAVTKDWVRALAALQRQRERPDLTFPAMVAEIAAERGAAPALIGMGETLSYAALAARSNQYARWALKQGVARGDCVCLLMANCPDYVAIWLGLTQVGCVVGLLNTYLGTDAIAHGIRSAAATHVIVAGALRDSALGAKAQLPAAIGWWWHGATADEPQIDRMVAALDDAPLGAAERRPPAAQDRALLIYTSGTTGLPKAANVSHARVMAWSGWFAGMMDARPEDRLFNCLPMYHSVGGVVAIGSMLAVGGSVVVRERFSASRFWDDVTETGCTVVQYIGELCRYLLQSPPHPRETAHRIRVCCGNGLRGDVWGPFQLRFRIPRILEFYAATEGGVSLYNAEGKPGAIGRVPAFLAHRFPVALVRCDLESGEALRDADGRCVPCAVDEPGEALGPIGSGEGAPLRRFDGYTDAAASARKVLRDVFKTGDTWFRTGDLMRKDAAGYYYFIDRLGDTYRWKGENVSTTEVAAVLGACAGVIDAVVFGVEVPGAEGKAGMAVLVTDERFDLAATRAHLQASLPGYARPMFLRLGEAIAMTGTFKLTKTALAQDGYAGAGVWIDDPASGTYVPYHTSPP